MENVWQPQAAVTWGRLMALGDGREYQSSAKHVPGHALSKSGGRPSVLLYSVFYSAIRSLRFAAVWETFTGRIDIVAIGAAMRYAMGLYGPAVWPGW